MSRARGTDFANARTDVVSPGTTVTLVEIESGKPEVVHILGAWDGNATHNVVSYLTPMAQSILNKAVGVEAELPAEGGKRRVRIESIAPADVATLATAGNAPPSEAAPVPVAEAH
ncbi:MAG TPA: hypothetical protein DCE44_15230 [Verrucomicrobiales bacterium]|nr:hypothetical protein [Verrucomicrobiales bacterium]